MRADLDGATLTYTPKAVDGDPIISTKEIPFNKKREFDPNLAPGTEKVVQKVNQELKQQQHQLMSILIQEKKLAKVNQQKNNKTTSG